MGRSHQQGLLRQLVARDLGKLENLGAMHRDARARGHEFETEATAGLLGGIAKRAATRMEQLTEAERADDGPRDGRVC